MPVNRRLTFNFRLLTNRKKALVGVSSAMADVGDVVLQQLRIIKFHTRAHGWTVLTA